MIGLAIASGAASAESNPNCFNASLPAIDIIAACNDTLGSDPAHAQAFQSRGIAWFRIGDYDHAIEDFSQAIKTDPKYIRAFYNRGLAWERKGKLENALIDFRYFAEVDPTNPDAQKAIARIGAAKKKKESAPEFSAAPECPADMVPSCAKVTPQGGTFHVPVTINGVITLNFTIDSGASDVSIPVDVVSTLIRAGSLVGSDFIGEQKYTLADGSVVPSVTFNIRRLKVGNRVLQNVLGSVASAKGSLLLGQSFLSRFNSWSIDNKRQILILN